MARLDDTDTAELESMATAWQTHHVPCMDCGGTFDPVCMDFDHRPGTDKKGLVPRLSTLVAVKREVAKCDVVCANCHRLRTYRRRDHGGVTKEARRIKMADPRQLSLLASGWVVEEWSEGPFADLVPRRSAS